jgi:hypothetical protein
MPQEFAHLNHIQSVFDTYKKTKNKTPEYQQEILDSAYKSYKETGEFGLWAMIFSADKKMCRAFDVMGVKIQAEKSLANYNELPNPTMLEMMATMAYTTSKTNDEFDQEKVNVWLEVFSSVKDFPMEFEKELKHWKDWHADLVAKHADYYKVVEKSEPVESIVITVPLIVRNESGDTDAYPPQALVDNLVENFNGFQLESYMEVTDFVQKSSLELNGEHWKFTFETSRPVTPENKDKLLEKLKGQLSDGWGESIEQQEELYSVSFDYKNAKFSQPTKKPKMK